MWNGWWYNFWSRSYLHHIGHFSIQSNGLISVMNFPSPHKNEIQLHVLLLKVLASSKIGLRTSNRFGLNMPWSNSTDFISHKSNGYWPVALLTFQKHSNLSFAHQCLMLGQHQGRWYCSSWPQSDIAGQHILFQALKSWEHVHTNVKISRCLVEE